jgi:centractin
VPVYEGFALTHSIARSNVAGRNVTQQLQLLLRRTGLCLSTTAETDLAKQMKEELCYLTPAALTDEQAEKDARVAAKTQYKLPDGQVIHLSSERHEAPNVLFDPSLFGSEEPGAADILVNAIYKSDIDLRPKLYSQIVLAGGSTLTQGFGERLLSEVRRRAPAHTKLRISAPPDRIHSAYVGGSILASLATFQTLWVSRDAYEERGSAVLHERDLL